MWNWKKQNEKSLSCYRETEHFLSNQNEAFNSAATEQPVLNIWKVENFLFIYFLLKCSLINCQGTNSYVEHVHDLNLNYLHLTFYHNLMKLFRGCMSWNWARETRFLMKLKNVGLEPVSFQCCTNHFYYGYNSLYALENNSFLCMYTPGM